MSWSGERLAPINIVAISHIMKYHKIILRKIEAFQLPFETDEKYGFKEDVFLILFELL